MNQELIEFCNYVQPIVNACGGFIKSAGYMCHIPGTIILMTEDETFLSSIDIPVVFNIYMTAIASDFMALKTDEEKSDLFNRVYFTRYNVKAQHMVAFNNQYKCLDMFGSCRYSEDDCHNIPGFDDSIGSSDISFIHVSDGVNHYMLPAGKSITPVTKSDSASIKIYDCIYNPSLEVKTLRYRVYKKKFKLNVDIFTNILLT